MIRCGLPPRRPYFDYGHYDDATKRFSAIITAIPGTKQAEISLKILLSYYAERKDLDKTIALAEGFLGNKSLTKSMREFVTISLRNAMFNQAMEQEKDQKYEAAAVHLWHFTKCLRMTPALPIRHSTMLQLTFLKPVC